MAVSIQAMSPTMNKPWQHLYRAYAEFYRTAVDDAVLAQTWAWLQSGELGGCCAVDENHTIHGFAHWTPVLRPLRGARLLYLHDLFVSPDSRRRGVGGQLLRHVSRVAADHSCTLVRWATAKDNAVARRLYDKVAHATDWVIYEQNVSPLA